MKTLPSWFWGGLLLAIILTSSILLTGSFGIASPKTQSVAAPSFNYRVIFLLSVIIGGFTAARLSVSVTQEKHHSPCADDTRERGWLNRLRLVAGGFLVLFGARLADGTASEHMLAGLVQTSVSSYLFVIATFLTAIPLAMIVHGRVSGHTSANQPHSSGSAGHS